MLGEVLYTLFGYNILAYIVQICDYVVTFSRYSVVVGGPLSISIHVLTCFSELQPVRRGIVVGVHVWLVERTSG